MSYEIEGKIVALLEPQGGTSAKGPWKKRDFVIETNGQYPKKVALSCWGERVDELNNNEVGSTVKVAFDVESREYNGRYYTDLRVYRLNGGAAGSNSGGGNNNNYAPKTETAATSGPANDQNFTTDDDLPF